MSSMNDYRAPLQDMSFAMYELAGFCQLNVLKRYNDATPEVADAVLAQAARFAQEVLSPLNRLGDREGCGMQDGVVTTPTGWRIAYSQFCKAGWNGLAMDTAYGGQGLPQALGAVVREIMGSANMAFSLCPLLTQGAVNALTSVADEQLRQTFLPKLIAGTWTGTMNLTEPQAGSDLAMIRTRATPRADGSFDIVGQKIFITYGEHDLSENIVHLVLARLPDAPAGVKGISLFLVPKFLVRADGSLGARNDLRGVALEHKLGIHASPTCTMTFGDQGGATGYLVGAANHGLEAMFIMMNEARLGVGLQGVSMAERAYQLALNYARTRKQGRDVANGALNVTIDQHPDVRRMLMVMKSRTEAGRALAYYTYSELDRAQAAIDTTLQQRHLCLVEFLTPIVKAGCTEMAVDVCSLGIQVLGGTGYIEESGAPQLLRDARITTIYEGTTGIQANDLLLRKLLRDEGATATFLAEEIQSSVRRLATNGSSVLQTMSKQLTVALKLWSSTTADLLTSLKQDPSHALGGACSYLHLSYLICTSWLMAKSALIAQTHLSRHQGDAAAHRRKIATASFYADHLLSQAGGYAASALDGNRAIAHLGKELFDAE